MAKLTLNDLTSLVNPATVIGIINTNNARIEEAIDNTLSRDGSTPNQMEADIDMNNHRIVNLPEPLTNHEPVRRQDLGNIMDLADDFEQALADVADDVAAAEAAAASASQDAADAAASAQTAVDAVSSIGTLTVDSLSSHDAGFTTTFDPTVLFVRTAGYYAIGDGGGALYKRVNAQPTHGGYFRSVDRYKANGVIDAVNGGYWEYCTEGEINVKQFGAKDDLTFDSSPYLTAAVEYANGDMVFAPKGKYRLDSPIATTKQVNIRGVGTGGGPGVTDLSACTVFVLYHANPTFISITGNYYSHSFRDFQIWVHNDFRPASGGAGLILVYDLSPDVSDPNIAYCRINNVHFNGLSRGVYMTNAFWPVIENCIFEDWVIDGIYSAYGGRESSGGIITKNSFFGDLDGGQTSCINLRNGYTVVSFNEILGAQYGVKVQIADYPSGFVHIVHNTIEEQWYNGVFMESLIPGNSIHASMVTINDNEFSNINPATFGTYIGGILINERADGVMWLTSVSVKNNIVNSTCGAGGCLIDVRAGSNVMISGNILREFGAGAPVGVRLSEISVVGSVGTGNKVIDNSFDDTSTFTAKHVVKAGTYLRDID